MVVTPKWTLLLPDRNGSESRIGQVMLPSTISKVQIRGSSFLSLCV